MIMIKEVLEKLEGFELVDADDTGEYFVIKNTKFLIVFNKMFMVTFQFNKKLLYICLKDIGDVVDYCKKTDSIYESLELKNEN